MIVPDPNEVIFNVEFEAVEPINPVFYSHQAARISEVLGPDGEPLMVPFERPKLGFDLSARKRQAE